MGHQYNVFEALHLLQKHYVTNASVQMVTRWIREGKLRGTRTENRKDGYLIEEDDLYEFIEERNPGMTLHIENEKEKVENTILPHRKRSQPTTPQNNMMERLEKHDQDIQLILEKIEILSNDKDFFPLTPQNIDLETRQNQLEERLQILSKGVEHLEEEVNKKLDLLINNMIKTENTSSDALTDSPHKEDIEEGEDRCTWDEFNKMVQRHIPEELDVSSLFVTDGISHYYATLFENDKIKKEHLTPSSWIKCPFDEGRKKKKSLHDFVKMSFPKFLLNYVKERSQSQKDRKNDDSEPTQLEYSFSEEDK
ncbi:MAG: hypothetical protein ACQET8_14710 [Bacillota bacterium]